ncbi:DUF4179 domain-containing protein [bacterium]|nr:DUF4179 domain-containing protein [bacterium]
MKHNLKLEMKQSMDSLRFSDEEKNAMVYDLLDRTRQEKTKKHSGRKLVILALAACLVLTMLTGAAVFTRWSTTAQTRYNPSQDIKEQAQKSGLSVMLEETKGAENPGEVLSVTDQGITITAVQSIVDNYHAEIIFRIEGFDLPEDKLPAVWPTVTIDGDDHIGGSQTGWFFDGTTRNDKGEWVYASDGSPVKFDDTQPFSPAILDYVADDGSLEYTYYINFEKTDGCFMGKEIVFSFHSIDFQSDKKAGMPEPQVEGNWELKWTLTGTSDSVTVTPNAKIGDSDVILLDAEIGQKTIRVRYQLKDYPEGWDELFEFPQALWGVRMKDGSEHWCGAGAYGFEDEENMIFFTRNDISDAILDISQVESLMFRKGLELDGNGKPTIQTFYYIPVSAD